MLHFLNPKKRLARIDYFTFSEKIDIDHEMIRLTALLEEEKSRNGTLTNQLSNKTVECSLMKEERDGALLKSQVSDDKMLV